MSWSSQGVTDCWREMFLVEDELKNNTWRLCSRKMLPK